MYHYIALSWKKKEKGICWEKNGIKDLTEQLKKVILFHWRKN